MKVQIYPAGTDNNDNLCYFFSFNWGNIPLADVQILDAEEIGQILGGN